MLLNEWAQVLALLIRELFAIVEQGKPLTMFFVLHYIWVKHHRSRKHTTSQWSTSSLVTARFYNTFYATIL
jgi:hypothetical protein